MFTKAIQIITLGGIVMVLGGTVLLSAGQGVAPAEKLPLREEIDVRYKWRTQDIYPTDKDWEKDFKLLKGMVGKLDQFKGKLGESAENLLSCLKIRDEIDIRLGKLSFYASLKSDEDTRVSKYQAYRDRVSSLSIEIRQKSSFIQPEIIATPEEKIRQFLEENPELKIYEHYIEDILRTKKHVLSTEEEQLLALSGDLARTPYQVFSMFNNADITFPAIKNEKGEEIELTKGRFFAIMRSPHRQVRENAFNAFYNTYNQWRNTLSATLSGAVKRDMFYARARKYSGSLEAALDVDNIPTAVYDNVINTLNDNLAPMHRYILLRKKMLGIEKVHPWDLYVPILREIEWRVSYDQAVKTIEEALQPLGAEYVSVLEDGFSGGWIDVFENVGKRAGAYSSAIYGAPHPYILLNYNNQLTDMFTVAHEMGHSLHSYFTLKNQPYIYSDYSIFVAEVASTLNEALLINHLLNTTRDKSKKLYLLNHYIDQIRGTVYIQAIFAEFEKVIHEKAEAGDALTTDAYNEIARDIYTRYYGPDFEMDSLYDINWCRIPHFYYNFYVYQYVTGFSAATALSQKILAGDEEARKAYLNFLSQGSSDYPINLLRDAGVDMTSPEPIVATAQLFTRLLNEMEELLDK